MKKLLIAALIAGTALAGCQRQELIPEHEKSHTGFIGRMEGMGGVTKTYLDQDNNVLWSVDDQISIFAGATIAETYRLDDSSAGTEEGSFTLVEEQNGGFVSGSLELDHNIAIYPGNPDLECSKAYKPGETAKYNISYVEIPAEQSYRQESFDKQSFPMVAVSSKEDNTLNFKNICGALKLKLKGNQTIDKIILRGNQGERLAGYGSVTASESAVPQIEFEPSSSYDYIILDCGGIKLSNSSITEFIFSLAPADFKYGFNLEIIDMFGDIYYIWTDKANSVKRSTILSMPACDVHGNPVSENTIELETTRLSPVELEISMPLDGIEQFYSVFGDYEASTLMILNDFKWNVLYGYNVGTNRWPEGFKGNPNKLAYPEWDYQIEANKTYYLYFIKIEEGKDISEYKVSDINCWEWTTPAYTSGGEYSPTFDEIIDNYTSVTVPIGSNCPDRSYLMWQLIPEAEMDGIADPMSYLLENHILYTIDGPGMYIHIPTGSTQTMVLLASIIDSDGKYGELFIESFTPTGVRAGGEFTPSELSATVTTSSIEVTVSAPGAHGIFTNMIMGSVADRTEEELIDFLVGPYSGTTEFHTGDTAFIWAGCNQPNQTFTALALAIDEDGRYGDLFIKEYTTESYSYNDMTVSVSAVSDITWDNIEFEVTSSEPATSFLYALIRTDDWLWKGSIGQTAQYMAANPMEFNIMDFPETSTYFTFQSSVDQGGEYCFIAMAADGNGVWSEAGWRIFEIEKPENWGLVGSFIDWDVSRAIPMIYDKESGVYYLNDIELTATDEFKIAKDFNWGLSYGLQSGDTYLDEGVSYMLNSEGGCANLRMKADGIYDILFWFDPYSNSHMIQINRVENLAKEPWDAYEEDNLWLYASRGSIGFYFADENWTKMENPVFSEDTDPSDGLAYSVVIPEGLGTQQWQAQLWFEKLGIATSSDKTYDFQIILESDNADIEGVTIQLSDTDANMLWFNERVHLEAGTGYCYQKTAISGQDFTDLRLTLDFGGAPAGTTIYIKDIIIRENNNL